MMSSTVLASRLGRFRVVIEHGSLIRITPTTDPVGGCNAERDLLEHTLACLDGRREGTDLPVRPAGRPFQCAIWALLRTIPRGSTRVYADLAEAVGNPRATRAVGSACGANPLPVIIPCHRVIRRDGGLGGFAWGTSIKMELLVREGHRIDTQDRLLRPLHGQGTPD